MRTYREGDIVKLADPSFPWEEPDATNYLLFKNNGPKQQLIVAGVSWKQPDIWSLIAVDGDSIGSIVYSTIYHLILVQPAVVLPTYSDTLPPI